MKTFMLKLSEFKEKNVPGLYSFDHYEHQNGAFIQISQSRPRYYVFRDKNGVMENFNSYDELKKKVEAVE